MKKTIAVIVILCLSVSVSFAETVVKVPYTTFVDGNERNGEYTGEMIGDMAFGYGIFTTGNENGFKWHYIGSWVDGLMNGQGATYWEDGSIEIGEYENGKFVFGYCNYDGLELEPFVDEQSVYVNHSSVSRGFPQTDAAYVGNIGTKKFHVETCRYAVNMKDTKKITFHSIEEALQAGYSPCKTCKPTE